MGNNQCVIQLFFKQQFWVVSWFLILKGLEKKISLNESNLVLGKCHAYATSCISTVQTIKQSEKNKSND